jgi:hypothetical protein
MMGIAIDQNQISMQSRFPKHFHADCPDLLLTDPMPKFIPHHSVI